jgi:hypothetical protein
MKTCRDGTGRLLSFMSFRTSCRLATIQISDGVLAWTWSTGNKLMIFGRSEAGGHKIYGTDTKFGGVEINEIEVESNGK